MGSSAARQEQWETDEPGGMPSWGSAIARCNIGASNWLNRGSKPFLAVGIRPRRRRRSRLKRELEITRQERDILKKVVSIFSRESQ